MKYRQRLITLTYYLNLEHVPLGAYVCTSIYFQFKNLPIGNTGLVKTTVPH